MGEHVTPGAGSSWAVRAVSVMQWGLAGVLVTVVVAGCDDGAIRVHELLTGAVCSPCGRPILPSHGDGASAAETLASGTAIVLLATERTAGGLHIGLAIDEANTLRVWDLWSGVLVSTVHAALLGPPTTLTMFARQGLAGVGSTGDWALFSVQSALRWIAANAGANNERMRRDAAAAAAAAAAHTPAPPTSLFGSRPRGLDARMRAKSPAEHSLTAAERQARLLEIRSRSRRRRSSISSAGSGTSARSTSSRGTSSDLPSDMTRLPMLPE